jgi:hypothetical protein
MTKSDEARKPRRRPLVRLPTRTKGPFRLGKHVRPKLTRLVAELAPDEATAVGSGGILSTCELVGLADVTAQELRDDVRLSANPPGAEWLDTRAYARTRGVAFVPQVDGVDHAVLLRHPAYVSGEVGDFVQRNRDRRADRSDAPAPPQPAEDRSNVRHALPLPTQRVGQPEERSRSLG